METPKITDWISVGIALFAAGVSIWAIIANKKNTKIAEEAKEIAGRALGESYRPYVIVKLYNLDSYLYFEISNIGNRSAKEVKIEIEPNFKLVKSTIVPERVLDSFEKVLYQEYLAPYQRINFSLKYNASYFNRNVEIVSDIRKFTIKFKSLDNEEYKFNHEIDVNSFMLNEIGNDFSENSHFAKIVKQMEQLNKNIRTLKGS